MGQADPCSWRMTAAAPWMFRNARYMASCLLRSSQWLLFDFMEVNDWIHPSLLSGKVCKVLLTTFYENNGFIGIWWFAVTPLGRYPPFEGLRFVLDRGCLLNANYGSAVHSKNPALRRGDIYLVQIRSKLYVAHSCFSNFWIR